jgi:hypothetical protein
VLHSFLPPAGCVLVSSLAINSLNDTSEFSQNVTALSCVLTPQSAENQLPDDDTHSVTATVMRGTSPVTAATVDFTVAGVNNVGSPDPSTNGSGVAVFDYTSNGTPGDDAITASVTNAGETATCLGPDGSEGVEKRWLADQNPPQPTQPPMAVELVDLRAGRIGTTRSIKVEWKTASEFKNAGFRVLRKDPMTGELKVVSTRLIPPASGELRGGSYTFVDWTPPATAVSYYVEDIDTSGASTRHGPVAVGRAWERTKNPPGIVPAPGAAPPAEDLPPARSGRPKIGKRSPGSRASLSSARDVRGS